MHFSKLRDAIGKFQYLNIFHYASMGCYYTFIVAFLTKNNYTPTQIGLIFTINSIVAIIAQPIWGLLCDKIRSVRKVYATLGLVISVTVPLITVFHSHVFHMIYIPSCIILFYCPFNPLLDAWIVQGIKNLPGKTYGSIRLWGSAGYMVTVAFLGWISDRFGVETVFYFFSFFMLINVCIALSIREEGVPETIHPPAEPGAKKPLKELLKNYQYISFIVCMFVLHLPLVLKNGFFTQRLYLAGGTDVIFGLCQAASALVEIPVFLITSKLLNRFKAEHLLLFTMSIYLVHFLITTLPIPAWSFVLLHCMNGLGYSVFLVASISYIDSLSPPEMKTSALTIATGIYGGASGIIGNFVSGIVIDSIGLIRSFLYGSAFVAFSIVFFIVILAIGNRGKRTDGEVV